MKKSLEVFLLAALLLTSLFFINFETSNAILSIIKTVLMISTVIFIPGYLLTKLLFNKSLEIAELLVISIGLSIALVILSGIAINFSDLLISARTMLNLVWFIAFVLVLIGFFKKDFKFLNIKTGKVKTGEKTKRKEANNRLFYLNLVLFLIVVCNLIYLSIAVPPKEEFVELSWKLSKVEDVTDVYGPDCRIERCSLSGINKIGKAELDNEEYNILLIDLNEPEKYDAVCIDLNHNDAYCENLEEGPFWPPDGFFIGSSAFSFNLLGSDNIIIFNYPKNVDEINFTVSYIVKSHYSDTLDYDLFLAINRTTSSAKTITLEPNQEALIQENVILPRKGDYRVEVLVSPVGVSEKASISFFVSY